MSIDVYAANIREWLDNATEDDVEAGLVWYDEAYKFCVSRAAKYGIDPVAVATVVAILSPQKKWEQNLEEADAMLEEVYNKVVPEAKIILLLARLLKNAVLLFWKDSEFQISDPRQTLSLTISAT